MTIKRRRTELLTAVSAAALLVMSQTAHASTLVATVIGAYDAQCGSCGLVNGTSITNYATNGGTEYDNPNLFFLNTTNSAFTNVTITLTGYQDAAHGGSGATFQNPGPGPASTIELSLPNIAAHTVYELTWGSLGGLTVLNQSGLPLFAYDYDDELGNLAGSGATDSLGHTCGSGSGAQTSICSYVGNFDVAFSAKLNGGAISSIFSPDNTQGGGNVQGSFVGWEGLDADGLSETYADAHTATLPGTLANIYTGTNGTQGQVPEPASLALLGAGIGALGLVRRRRRIEG